MVGTVAIEVLDDAQWTELDEGAAVLLAGAVGATGETGAIDEEDEADETGEEVGDCAAA